MIRDVIGIDPGLDGALAWYDLGSGRVVKTVPMPTGVEHFRKKGVWTERRVLDIGELTDTIAGFGGVGPSVFGAVELVHAIGGQGVVSTARFLEGFGIIKGILSGLRIPFIEVPPQDWQKAFGLIGLGKDAAVSVAKRRAPHLVASDFTPVRGGLTKSAVSGRADAALISIFGAEVAKRRNID